MTTTEQIAKQFRDVHFGGNWTGVNLKDTLADISWEQATEKVYNLNTIAVLVFHINYYVNPVLSVLIGKPLKASDKYSFDLPPITNDEGWQQLKNKLFADAESLALEMEKVDEKKLFDVFADEKYGTYYRNLHGIIEHTHYHLGQISLIKKILNQSV